MRNFLIGVAVGAVGMGVYTGYIKVNLGEAEKKETLS